VKAQVDRDLTTVSCFDRLLWLIKNLGRHSQLRGVQAHDDHRQSLSSSSSVFSTSGCQSWRSEEHARNSSLPWHMVRPGGSIGAHGAAFGYSIRNEDNWKLFSHNSGSPCPSHRTHLSGYMMTKRWNDHKNRNLGSVSKFFFFLLLPYPPIIPAVAGPLRPFFWSLVSPQSSSSPFLFRTVVAHSTRCRLIPSVFPAARVPRPPSQLLSLTSAVADDPDCSDLLPPSPILDQANFLLHDLPPPIGRGKAALSPRSHLRTRRRLELL
jgi:hypothetical protein